MAQVERFDVVIAGGGLAGLTLANALAECQRHGDRDKRLKIAWVAPPPPADTADMRTTALLAHSVEFLKTIEVWDIIHPHAAAMSVMRLVDNTNRLIRAPETVFKSMEIGLEAFGYNVINGDILRVLEKNLLTKKNIHHVAGKISDGTLLEDGLKITLDTGRMLHCRYLVGADGRNSTVRELANSVGGGDNIKIRERRYPQTAIVLNFSHALPHQNTSIEFHTPSGPFTVVPLRNRGKTQTSSLVWVETPAIAEQMILLPKRQLNREIEQRMHSVLGKTSIISPVQSFPISAMHVSPMAVGRFLLVGDAAHVVPPIGAQGFNLAIRDIEELHRLFSGTIDNPEKFANSYNIARRIDVASRSIGVNMFNRSLLSEFLPVQLLRSGALAAINEIPPLRRLMMREGVSPGKGMKSITDGLRNLRERMGS